MNDHSPRHNEPLRPIDSAIIPRFAHLATFMRTPYRPSAAGLDIALAGVPFDLGSTNRDGPRHGPAQIREMSRLIRQVNPTTRVAPFDLCQVADVGDAPVNPLDAAGSIDKITEFFSEIAKAGAAPVSVGGDHTVTLPIRSPAARTASTRCQSPSDRRRHRGPTSSAEA